MPSAEYFAGHFDGEGSLGMQRHNKGWRLQASVKVCHLPVLEYYKATFGGYVGPRASQSTHKMMWEWKLHHQPQLLAFLQTIEPFCLEKKPQIAVGIEWLLARQAFPKNRVPYDFILYSNRCASLLMELKRISIEAPLI